ncbi:diphthine synthase-like protein [Perkinsela sp. CCAP 1560/4]|nr:diphthine synthase-like protein [Perkinsela sp. CCAP 1560/4]|eukprot:KNH08077.1 diphthine synthase-like protein [Perkinsela sp. CCAP 1560/4]
MPLHLIGTGLGDETDLTLRGIELIRQSDAVFLESYTSIPCAAGFLEKLQAITGKTVEPADRYFVEDATALVELSKVKKVSLLVVGDPFSATTHSDLYIRCKAEGVDVTVVHNASILNAIGVTGLQLYRFGQVITLCFWTDNWRPKSWFPVLEENIRRGLHTLILLDIKTKEVSDENLARGRMDTFEPPRYMSVHEGIAQVDLVARELGSKCINESSRMIAVSRLGSVKQQILHGDIRSWMARTPAEVADRMGEPLHSLVLPGDLHPCELEHLLTFPAV